MHIPFKKTKDGILIEVRVEPRSSRKEITGIMDNVLKVKLTAPPVGGEANEQLIEVISRETGIRKSRMKIIKGHSAKKKIILIQGVPSL